MSRRPVIAELVGPAGAGKTTLARALTARDPGIRDGLPIPRGLHLRSYLGCLARFAPEILGRQTRSGRFLDRGRLRSMTYLVAWHRLARQERDEGWAVLLDHGPLFRLAHLRDFDRPQEGSRPFDLWWQRMRARWQESLDVILWLDAPGEVLATRIVERPRWHATKALLPEQRDDFVAGQRAALERLVEEAARAGGPLVLRLDTSQESVDALADRAIAALRARRDVVSSPDS